MTIDEAINKLEHGIRQLTIELESGFWEVGSDTENTIKERIKYNEQLIAWLITRRKAAEEMKTVFGWNITVDKGEIVKQEDSVIDSNVQEEINESKGDENSGENVSRETSEGGETSD